MRNHSPVLFTFIFALCTACALASPSLAEDSGVPTGHDSGWFSWSAPQSTTVYNKIATGYMFQDFGFMAADCIVNQGGITKSWTHDSLDLWYSTGCGGSANEVDLTWDHNGVWHWLEYQFRVAYYAVSIGKHRIDDVRDDILYTHIQLQHTFHVTDRLTVTPYVRNEFIDGVNDTAFYVIVRPGIVFDYKFTNWLSGQAEFAKAHNLTGNGMDPWQTTISLTADVEHFLPIHGLYVNGSWKSATTKAEADVYAVQLSYTF